MKLKQSTAILLVMFITACTPKYAYLNQNIEQPTFDRIIVIFDYLHLVDDVGKLNDYPEDINQKQITQLNEVIQTELKQKGYTGPIDFAMISSGIGLNPEVAYEHYVQGKKSEFLVYPPFYVDSPYHHTLIKQLTQSFADAQYVALAAVSKKTMDVISDTLMQPINLQDPQAWPMPEIAVNEAVGILHVRAFYPRVSFMKAMGVSLLSVGLSAGATGGAYISVVTPTGAPFSTALLFDNDSGEIVWKNQRAGDLSRFSEQIRRKFFSLMPQFD